MAGLLHPHRGSPRCTATAVNLMLGVFHVLLPCFRQGGGQVIEPVPSMVELWQAEDAELMLPPQADSDQTTREHSQEQSYPRPSGRALHLQPSVLDFGSQPVGLPKAQSFCAFNPSWDTNVEVKSLFTNGRHFHVSPIQSRVIPARGRSSFTVVFFPELEGSFEGTLFLNTTSHGILSYQVFGLGTSMFVSDSRNPLQNMDVIFPHLENIHLSQSQTEAINSSVWQVRLKCSVPFKKQQQCRSCFLSGQSLLLQIYFAVRLDGGQQDLETLRKYILENIFMIFVTADPQENLDETAMHVYVLNSGNALVHMQDIHHFLGDSLSVQFEPVMLLSSSVNFTKAASVSCTVAASDPEFDCSGKKNRTVLEAASPPYLCFSRNVTEGYIKFDTSKISFYMQPFQDPVGLWSVWLENNLNFGISLFEVVVADEAKSIFKIRNFTHMSALPPGCWEVFTLKIQAKDTRLDHLTKMRITTSTGVAYEVPIHIHTVFSKPGNPQFKKLRAQCGLHPIVRSLDHEQMHRWQKTFSLGLSAWSVDYELGTELYEKYQKMQDGAACRKKTSEATGSVQQKRDGEKPISRLLQLIAEPGLVVNFAATALSNSSVKYVTLKNPSPFPVTLQLLPLSLYPNPQALLGLLSKWYGVSEEAIDVTTAEFRLQKERRHPLEEQDDRSFEILEFTLQPWESRQVGVVFTPMDYRKVTSLIVIRNNLTILDMITVEGVGAREMLRVGGRLPGIGGSLRFKVPESTLMDCRQQLKESKQVLSITKIFKVENIGSLPITVLSMKINGYNCQGFGFEVLDCNTFSLSQNSSRELSIVFIPDFTSSWVIRELTLVTASNLEFHFTLNVTLPHHLLPLCADGVPGPSWEESFWRLTVVFVSFSLLSVVLIAFQQAQYILTEFLKLRHRSGGVGSNCQQNTSAVDTISSESYRSSCKSFSDSCSPPDKGKGKGFLAVTAPPSRSQNASKRGPASYSHSQKKHKCSVYYSIKQKSNSSTGSAAAACDAGQQHTSDTRPPSPKDSPCSEAPRENWPDCKPTDASDTGNQKHLTSPAAALGKEEPAPQNTLLPQRTAGESTTKEEPIKCMFPMETSQKISESVSEPKQQDSCVTVSSKVPENHSSRSLQQTASKKMEGNGRRVSLGSNRESSETAKKHIVREGTSERSVQSVPREERTCGRSNISPVKQEDSLRKKSPVEKRDGIFPNLNWNKNRTQARKSKKKNSVFTARGTDQYEMKNKSQEPERPEVRIQNRVKNWSSFTNGDVCKVEQKSGRLPARGETECYQILKRKCMDKFSSDSSSDCGSSRGSVRASRGSWGSWSSTSSSDGDKKNALPKQHYFPTRDTISQSGFPSEAPIALNLSHNICNTSAEANPISRYPEVLSPSFTNTSEAEKHKGLYPQDDLWSSQPVCLTNDLNYNLESTMTCVMQDPPPVQNNFVNWNGSCDGQFSRMYGSLELNDFSAYPEENMNYHNGFPCPEAQNPTFIDHQCQSTWSMSGPSAPPTPQTPTVPSTWEPASYVSASPYLSSTRSLSPMSGLFGSIWAPQNDAFDGYCPASGSPPHSQHVGNHSVICKQEYSSRFNPFHAYMNLDIWTATANRSASFPISRDSGYCGNM